MVRQPPSLVRRSPWSLDAWALVRPATAFQFIAAHPAAGSNARLLFGRPLFVAFVIGCVVSLVGTGTLTARMVIPATAYFSFVPVLEVVVFAAVAWRRTSRVPFAVAIDAFFTGHVAWTLLLIGIAASLAVSPPQAWWPLLMHIVLPAMVVVLGWSVYTDYCFYRIVMGSPRATAVRTLVFSRVITWIVVFVIFALPVLTPAEFVREVIAAVREVLG